MPEACTDCGRDAKFVGTEDGVESHLCGGCASRRSGIPNFAGLAAAFDVPRTERADCPHCGTTRREADDTGLFGCPLCYDVFPDLILKMSPQGS